AVQLFDSRTTELYPEAHGCLLLVGCLACVIGEIHPCAHESQLRISNSFSEDLYNGPRRWKEPTTVFDRITFDPKIMGGRACIRGMRIPVSVVVGQIAHGAATEEVLREYPDLEP